MTAYYNEIDPYAATWLRNLIAAGHLPAGEVDERSIVDVRPDDLRGFVQCHFFAGIGGWAYALRLAGWPDDRPVWTGSCPCQPLSGAGKRRGHADERHLWPAFHDLIAECRPSAVFGEQVASTDGREWLAGVRADLEAVGYAVGAADLCAASVGAPHIRQRLWWVADAAISTRERNSRGVFGEKAQVCREDGAQHGDSAVRPEHGRAVVVCRLADADGGLAGDGGLQPGRQHGQQPQDGCARRLADAVLPGRAERGPSAGDGPLAGGGGISRMGDASGQGLAQRGIVGGTQGRQDGASAGQGPVGRSDAGFWSPAEWLTCTDGKARRTQPGIFPLAHGVPARVGKLCAAGNAIVPQVAAEFIASCMGMETS